MKHLEVFKTQAAADQSQNTAKPRVRLITEDNSLTYFPVEKAEDVPAEEGEEVPAE